jgi:hypothetical protein
VQTSHAVPYFSQFESAHLVAEFVAGTLSAAKDPKWADSGAVSPEEYEFWAWRTCGLACLKMILAGRGLAVPPTVPLAEECTRAGGYVRHADHVDGLIYGPFADWIAERFDLKATVHQDLGFEEIAEMVHAGGLAMLSVHAWIRWPERAPADRGGHLVLVTGADEERLLINNPSGLPGQSQHYAPICRADLDRFSARRGMLIQPPVSATPAPEPSS